MKYKILATLISLILISAGSVYAAEDQISPSDQALPSATNPSADNESLGTQATPQSIGGQAGEVARELKGTASESLAVTGAKVSETSKKVEAEAQDTLKTLQQQWDVLAKQLQEKTKQLQGKTDEIRAQLRQQWQDFQKSFNEKTPTS